MTFVRERSVDIDTPGVGVRSWHSDGRLRVRFDGRTLSFRTSCGVARLVDDTHQAVATPDEIPQEVRDLVLSMGHRIHGTQVDDGGFTLLTGDAR